MIAIKQFSLYAYTMSQMTLNTTQGRELDVMVITPHHDKPAPTLILAPGAGYNISGPLLKELCEAVSQRLGFLTVCFNWSYMKIEGGERSAHHINEISDFETVIHYTLRHPQAHPEKWFLGGKSLGSIVALNRILQHKEASGLLLLTPVCRTTEMFLEEYKGLKGFNKKTLLIAGSHDTTCPLANLYKGLSILENDHLQLNILGGDHGLEVAGWVSKEDQEKNQRNFNLAIDITCNWLAQF